MQRSHSSSEEDNRFCCGFGEFHFIQTKSFINKVIKPEFSVDGSYFAKISKMCITEVSVVESYKGCWFNLTWPGVFPLTFSLSDSQVRCK